MDISYYIDPNSGLSICLKQGDSYIACTDNTYTIQAENSFDLYIYYQTTENCEFNYTLSANDIIFNSENLDVTSGIHWRYWRNTSFQAGTYEITLTLDPNNKIAEDNENNNTFTITLEVEGNDDYLLDTFWNQSGYFFANSDLQLNAYCPIDPSTKEHCLTGCGNTAAAQILYYYASEKEINFSIELDEDDAYELNGITINESLDSANEFGYLSFDSVNELLAEFDTSSAEDAAALIFASGVVAESYYGITATSSYTNLHQNIFERAGFESKVAIDNDDTKLINKEKLTDKGWEIIKNNIEEGNPILFGFANIGHGVVLDGYDSENDLYHINFGWGFTGNKPCITSDLPSYTQGSGWYSKDKINDFGPNCMIYDITPDDEDPTISVTQKYDKKENKVTLTINADDNIGVYNVFYQIGSNDEDGWIELEDDSLPVSQNCTVHFKVVDRQNNVGTTYITIDSIIVPLEQPQITLSTTSQTNQNVTLTAIFDKNSVGNYYSKDGGNTWIEWTETTQQIVIEENCNLTFKSVDKDGNSSFKSITINNIDKTDPTLTITGNPTQWTNQDVTLVAQTNEGIVKYSFDNETWFESTNVIVDANQTVYFKVIDLAGNTTEQTIEVNKIDKEIPILTVEGNPTELTNKVVTLTAAATDNNTASIFYKKDGEEEYKKYTSPFGIYENGIYYFYAEDIAGNRTEIKTIIVDKIDTTAPILSVENISNTEFTNQDIIITLNSNETIYYYDGDNWVVLEGNTFTATTNGNYQFKAIDAAGNESEIKLVEINNIDKDIPKLECSYNQEYTNEDVVILLNSNDPIYYFNNGEWVNINGNTFAATTNGYYQFKAEDAAGNINQITVYITNIDKEMPNVIENIATTLTSNELVITWDEVTDNYSGVANYFIKINGNEYTLDTNSYTLQLAVGSYTYQITSIDKAGNQTDWSNELSFNFINLAGDAQNITWTKVNELPVKTISLTNSKGSMFINTISCNNGIEFYGLHGSYTCNWYDSNNKAGIDSVSITEEKDSFNTIYDLTNTENGNNGNKDVFFVQTNKIWSDEYIARHNGSGEAWEGTKESVSLKSKNKIESIYIGSTDANMLVLTDSQNGDALFLEDLFSNLPVSITEQQARINKIDEIYAGDGDDIVDLTGKTFKFEGKEITIYGGNGNDTLWGSDCKNILFGDAGNDRIVGNIKDDIIIGGIGNDSMHGGGGSDIFVFGESFGTDTIEQLEGGSVILYIQGGDDSFWDDDTKTYSQGNNSIKIIGNNITISLKFDNFDTLPEGAFASYATENIFNKNENNNNGTLA